MSIAWTRATAIGCGRLHGKRFEITEPLSCRFRLVQDGSDGGDIHIVLDRDLRMPITAFAYDPEVEFVTDRGKLFYIMGVGYRGQSAIPGQFLNVVRE